MIDSGSPVRCAESRTVNGHFGAVTDVESAIGWEVVNAAIRGSDSDHISWWCLFFDGTPQAGSGTMCITKTIVPWLHLRADP